MKLSIHKLLAISTLLFSFSQAHAEQKEVFNGPNGSQYEIHYMAFVSTFLTPEIAKQYELIRSKAIGVVNISVIKVDADGKRKAVGAAVETKMTNDIQQQQFLSFKQIVEGKSIYYLAQHQFKESGLLIFDVTVYAEGSIQPMKFRFSQNFYND